MSTKTETDNTIKFDPTAMGVYRNLQTPVQNTLLDYIQDPLKASYFAQQVQMLSKANQGLLTRNTQNILTQAGSRGISPNSALMMSQLGKASRGASANMNNAYLQALMNANQNRMWATSQGQNYRPLQTGSHEVQTTSGLGTWLPQVIGAAASIGLAPFTGGTSLLGLTGVSKAGAISAKAGGPAFAPTTSMPINGFVQPTGPSSPWALY